MYGSSALNQEIVISFITGKRTIFNSPVQLKYIPEIAVAQNEKLSVQLPFYDVDNDYVSCRWANNYAEGGGIYAARIGILLQVSLVSSQIKLLSRAFWVLGGDVATILLFLKLNDSSYFKDIRSGSYHSL